MVSQKQQGFFRVCPQCQTEADVQDTLCRVCGTKLSPPIVDSVVGSEASIVLFTRNPLVRRPPIRYIDEEKQETSKSSRSLAPLPRRVKEKPGSTVPPKFPTSLVTTGRSRPLGGSVTLGKDVKTGKPVTIKLEDMLGGTYIIGRTGSGKSVLKVRLILDTINAGLGVAVLDPHGSLVDEVIKRLPDNARDDVILLDLVDGSYSFGLNLFECRNPYDDSEVSFIVDQVLEIFAKLFAGGDITFSDAPTMGQTLRNISYVLIANPGFTLVDIPKLLRNEAALKRLLLNVTNAEVQDFWDWFFELPKDERTKFTMSTVNRLGLFLTNPLIRRIFGQSKTSLNFREIMDKRKILLVKFSNTQSQITALVGAVLVMQIARAAFFRVPNGDYPQFNLFADEFQLFQTPTFAKLLTEVRKFKFGTVIGHQFRNQLDHANKGATVNAANIIICPVSGGDAEEMVKEVSVGTPTYETRKEPVLTPVSKPLDWFRQGKTHENERVTALVEKWLFPLFEMDKDYGRGHVWFTELCKQVDRFLRFAMRQKPEHCIDAFALAATTPGFFAVQRDGYLAHTKIWDVNYQYEYDITHKRKLIEQRNLHLIYPTDTDTRNAIIAFIHAYQGHRHFPQAAIEALFQERFYYHLRQSYALAHEIEITYEPYYIHSHVFRKEISVSVGQLTPIEQNNQKQLEELHNDAWIDTSNDRITSVPYRLHGIDPLGLRPVGIRSYKWQAFYNALRELGQGHYQESLSETPVHTVMLERRKQAKQLASEDKAKIITFVADWCELANLLNKNPILAPSGQYTEKPTNVRTFADMEKEQAKRLVIPEKRFTARYKLADLREGIIQLELLPVPHSASVIHERILSIERQTQVRYCKRREEIEQQIATRQATLVNRSDTGTNKKATNQGD